MKLLTLHLYPLMAFVSLLGTVAIPAYSQPITPATDGTGTTVNQNGNQFNIQGGTPSSNGANLFHSFSQFNVESNQTANFLTTPDIRNILGRVTGGNASTINGLIQVVGGNSNLFLMNPAGIIFGPNATLNVPASFSVTTATGIGFNDNNFWFKAMGTNNYSNLVGNPSGYHFDVSNPGAIVNQGNLSLNPGNNLTLLGGTVVNTGELSTAGGNITIAAVNGGDTLRISQAGHVLSLDISPSSAHLSGQSITPLSLAQLLTGGETNDASSVVVDAQGNLVLTGREGVAVASGNIDVSNSSDQGSGGQINVLGDRVAVIDANIQANGLNGGGRILIGGDLQGNGIVPNYQQTFVNNNSFISADALNNGNGGQVIIWSDDTTNFAGNISAKGGEFFGDGGFVEISGKQELIFDGNVNVSAALGEAGTILFDPKNIIIGAETPNQNEGDNQTFSATEIEELEGEIILQADNDITVNQPIETSKSIELTAGRSINLNADINTSSGNSNISLFGNDDGADINNREPGAGSINQAEGTTLNSGSGDITILLGILGENGDINLANLTTTGQLLVNANRGNIRRVSPNSLITADRAIFQTESIGGVGLTEAPLRIDVNNLEVFIGEKGLFLESINNLTIGGVSEEVEGISTFDGGDIEISINGNLTLTERIITSTPDSQPGNITISSSGNIDTTQTTLDANSASTSGGDVFLSADGDIKTGEINVSTGGNNRGGNVTINSGGEVDTTANEIFSGSLQGSGGNVAITSNGDLKTGNIDSRSDGSSNGGDITLESTGGNIDTSSGELSSYSVGGDAGNVSITSQGNIKTRDIFSSAGEPLDVDGDLENSTNTNSNQNATGSGGDITLTAGGTIDTSAGTLESFSRLGAGGIVSITSKGDIATGGVFSTAGEPTPTVGATVNTTTTQTEINSSNSGNITIESTEGAVTTTAEIDTAAVSGNAGSITVKAFGDIKTESIQSSTFAGEGGDITIESTGGSIDTTGAARDAGIFSTSTRGNAGNVNVKSNGNLITGNIDSNSENGRGGSITLESTEGNIDTSLGELGSFSDTGDAGNVKIKSFSDLKTGKINSVTIAGTGGDITLESTGGSVDTTIGEIFSAATDGNAGNVAITSNNDLITGAIDSNSTNGQGGNITLESTSGNVNTSGGFLSSFSQTENAGDVNIKSFGDLITGGIDSSSDGNGRGGNITLESIGGNINSSAGELASSSRSGNAGTVSLTSDGNITTGNISSFAGRDFGEAEDSENSGSGDGGSIILKAGGTIDTTAGTDVESNLESFSRDGSGGNIILEAKGDITTDRILSSAGDPDNGNILAAITQTQENAASSGDISIKSTEGSVTTTAAINSFATTGDGGSVTVESFTDLNIGNEINSRSDVDGAGGNIILESQTGAITIEGELSSFSQLGNAGGVNITSSGDLTTSDIDSRSNGSGQGGSINLESKGGNVNTTGGELRSFSELGNAGGVNIISSGDLTTSDIDSRSNGSGQGGSITLESTGGNVDTSIGELSSFSELGNAGGVNITSSGNLTTSDIDSRSKGSGQGGSINLESTGGNVDTSGGELSSFSELGNAGGVNITSSGNLTTASIDSRSKGNGQGGSINLESTGGNVDTSGGELSSFSQLGNAGNVNIISNTDLITGTINSRSEGNGQGGDVTLTAKGKIDAGSVESFSRQGTGGDITIIGDGDINISSNQTDDEEAGINSRAGTSSDGGNIEIKSQTGNVTINSELSSSSQTGNGGNIKISAGGDINTTSGELGSFSGEEINQNQNSQTLAGQNQGGQGGDITLEAEGEINAGVLQSFSREGSGGSITLEAKGNITTSEIISSAADPEDRPPVGGENSGNQIITQSQVEEPTSRQSGNIRIESTEGTVKTQGEIISYSNQGNAGNIDVISNSDVDIADGATIDSRADSSGNGGAIKIESKTGAITINSELSSSSQTGEGGPVEIRATGNITSGTISSFSEGNGNGGNITLESTGGDINTTSGELGSFSGEEIDETPGSQTFAGGNQGGQGGNITLEAEGNIDVGDIESFSREGSGGSITLEAKGNITTTNEIISSAADPEERPAVGGENSGNQTITQSQVEEPTGRQSGNIRIESKEGTVKTQGEIISYSNDGPGGNISIIGDGDIDIRTGAIDSRTDSTNRTNGGEIFIESKTGNITIEGELSSSSQTGKGGDIDINAPGDITSEAISSYSDGNGDGGAINITSTQGNLTIGEILSSSGEPIAQRAQNPEQTNSNSGENTTGGGGAITLKADEGNITVGDIESFSRQGAAGDISVSAKGNIITDAIISSAGDPENIPAPGRNADNATRTQSQVEEQNNRPAGGDISIISTEGTVTTNAEITSYSDKGNGGNISIFSQGDIRIITDSTPKTNAANIDSRSDGTSGSGGNIMLESQTGIIDAPGEFASSSQTGNGGNVEIFAPGNIQVETILSFSEGDGNGGDVNITGDSSIQTGTIASFTAGSGNSGNISIFADGAIDTSVGQLLSFSAEGEGGNVTLSATENITTGFIESFSGGGTRGGNITLETTNGNIDTTVGPLDVAIDLDIDIVGLSLGAEANISTDADVSSPDVATIFAEERANLSSSAPEGTGGNILIIQQGQGEITTSNISSFGGEDSGSVNIINNDGNINTGVIFSTAINGTGGQISLETMNNGDLNINHIATYADTENGVGGDISLDASGVVNINNIASFGNAGSGDVTIQSSSGSINTGTIQTRAPNGTSGNITLNTFSTQGDIRTASVTTQGGAAAGQVEIIATDGSVTTEDLESSSESGSAGGINVVAGEDIETGDQTVDSATGDATINNEAGGDITTGDQTAITSVGDATINNVAGGDITTGDQTAITGEGDATINNEAGRDITTGDQTAITGEGDATINNVTGGDITTGDQTAITSVGDATINNEAGGNIITGDQTAITSVGDATINNVTGGDITTGDITGIGDITNIINQPGGELNTGEIIQINPSPSIPTDNTLPQLLPQTSVTPGNLSNLTQLPVTPGNLPNLTQLPITQTPINQNIPPSNNQVLNPVTTQIIQSVQGNSTITTTNNPNLPNKQSDRQKVNINTDTTTALENINIVNSTPLTVAANSQTLITIEQTRNDEFEDYFESDLSNQITSTQNIREVLIDIARQTGNNSAIIYVTAYPDALQLVLYTPGSDPILKTIPNTNRKELMKALLTLRAQITNPARRYTNSYLPPAQKLYNWLIAPILAELEAANIDTLLFSMDEGLRALPVAVLHDGEQFLVEKYSLSLIPSVSLMDTNYRPLQDTQVLAMGASEFIEQSALPAVPTELETISQKLWQGSKFINEEFTRNNLLAQRENYSYPIIHLATHAEFKPGKANNSYIQLWGDEQLKLDQIRELGWNEPAVELLVLSACRTAFGDKNAELGFAGLAVAAGVKSALASIWYVSDEGTLGLMTEFYVHLNNAKIKAEALRQAQLAMLRGEVVIAEGELRGPGIRGAVVLPPALGKFENKNLSHPYYWSGFMMIGSPW